MSEIKIDLQINFYYIQRSEVQLSINRMLFKNGARSVEYFHTTNAASNKSHLDGSISHDLDTWEGVRKWGNDVELRVGVRVIRVRVRIKEWE